MGESGPFWCSVDGGGKIPWRMVQQAIPVFLPGESPWTEEPGGSVLGQQRVGHD